MGGDYRGGLGALARQNGFEDFRDQTVVDVQPNEHTKVASAPLCRLRPCLEELGDMGDPIDVFENLGYVARPLYLVTVAVGEFAHRKS